MTLLESIIRYITETSDRTWCTSAAGWARIPRVIEADLTDRAELDKDLNNLRVFHGRSV